MNPRVSALNWSMSTADDFPDASGMKQTVRRVWSLAFSSFLLQFCSATIERSSKMHLKARKIWSRNSNSKLVNHKLEEFKTLAIYIDRKLFNRDALQWNPFTVSLCKLWVQSLDPQSFKRLANVDLLYTRLVTSDLWIDSSNSICTIGQLI